jgi:hypothetical protein
MKKSILVKIAFIFLLVSYSSFGQVFIPKNKQQILEKIENNYDYQVNLLRGKYKSKIRKEYKRRKELITEVFLDSTFIFVKLLLIL